MYCSDFVPLSCVYAAVRLVLSRADWTKALLDAAETGKVGFDILSLDQRAALSTHSDRSLGARAKASDEVFNVASGTETSLAQLASALASVMGQGHLTPEFAAERAVNPVPRRLAATAKAERLLGFRSTVSLEQGLRELVEWWRSERRASAAAAAEQEAVAS